MGITGIENNLPKEYLEAVINHSMDAIITINDAGMIEYVNPATVDIFGYERSELLGRNISMLMPSPDHENHDFYIQQYLATGKAKILGIGREVNAQRKDGYILPVRLAVSEAHINGKHIFIGIIHDLSEIKTVEAQILELNQELEKSVAERTEELAMVVNKLLDSNQKLLREINERKVIEEALRKSEDELKNSLEKEIELSQLKSRFVTMASHEFRTPLTSILTSADLIESYTSAPDDKRIKHIQRIKNSVNNMINILNDLLSLSRLEENRVDKKLSIVNLSSFIKEVTDEVQGLLKPGQAINSVIESRDGEYLLDSNILKNILYNLLSNAIKYSNEGQPVDLEINTTDGNLTMSVRDYGIGIPQEDQALLFTRFFRARNAENIQGTGLGLNIVRRYLQLLNGDISFESEEGKGTIFRLSIPVSA